MRLLGVPMAEAKFPGFFDVALLDFRALMPRGHAARGANYREFRANAFQLQHFSPRGDCRAMLLRNAHDLQPVFEQARRAFSVPQWLTQTPVANFSGSSSNWMRRWTISMRSSGVNAS